VPIEEEDKQLERPEHTTNLQNYSRVMPKFDFSLVHSFGLTVSEN